MGWLIVFPSKSLIAFIRSILSNLSPSYNSTTFSYHYLLNLRSYSYRYGRLSLSARQCHYGLRLG